MYRAYHAMRGGGLSGPGGKTTHAVYIFVNMLRKLIQDHQPQYIARLVRPARARRSATSWSPTTRPTARRCRRISPSRFRGCTRPAKRSACRSSPRERYEADDVIGTLATKAAARRLRGRDRHRRQGLLSAGPRRHQGLQPARRRHLVRRRGSEGEVRRPAGAGRRRARADGRLHRQHQGRARHRREGRARSHREATARSRSCSRMPPRSRNKRYREGLLEHADDARQSRELARIRIDVPVEFDPEALRYRGAVAPTLLRALHPHGLPIARDGVRADGGYGRQGLRGRRHGEGVAGAGRGAARQPDGSRCACCPTRPSAMRAGIVGLSFSTAPRRARYVPLAAEPRWHRGSVRRSRRAALADGARHGQRPWRC